MKRAQWTDALGDSDLYTNNPAKAQSLQTAIGQSLKRTHELEAQWLEIQFEFEKVQTEMSID